MFGKKNNKTSSFAGVDTILDFNALASLADENKDRFSRADPFPYILFENFINPNALSLMINAFPSADLDIAWRRADAVLGDQPMQHNKLGMPHEISMPAILRQLIWELNSGIFIGFLEQLTGIQNLLPDPSLQGAGLHQSLPGAILGIHADFTHHKKYNLSRRLNILIYLNENWREEYEGHLELWSKDMTGCVKRIMPIGGRCVIFKTDSNSYHGSPTPLNCPAGTTRKSIALYYYTNGREDAEVEPTKATGWRNASRENLPAVE
ncbi:MAG: hypothetical protein ACI90U_003065 [Pseudomonadales bacterium]|jgi:hypothetical protein